MSNEKPQISRRKVLWGAVAAGGAALFGLEGLREASHIVFSEIEISIDGLAAEFDGFRIALFSDLHVPAKASVELVRHACELAMKFRPDLIALPGDFVHKRYSGVPDFGPYLADLQAPEGVFGGLGNHDHWVDAERVSKGLATETRVHLIDNSFILLNRGSAQLALAAVGDLWEGFVVPAKALGPIGVHIPRILLSHNPDYAEDMRAPYRVDLQLSGHTHGGEINLPGATKFIPSKYGTKFRSGLCQGKKHRVYVTRGIATVGPGRIFCAPEVTGIILRR